MDEERNKAIGDFFSKFSYNPNAFKITVLDATPAAAPRKRLFPSPLSKRPRPEKKKQYINKRLRNAVWSTYMGAVYQGLCYCCNRKYLDVFSYHCGHVLSEHYGGETTLKNLRPICALCNTSCSVRHMRKFAVKNGFTDSKICLEASTPVVLSSGNNKHPDK
jgi:hypothetical protein